MNCDKKVLFGIVTPHQINTRDGKKKTVDKGNTNCFAIAWTCSSGRHLSSSRISNSSPCKIKSITSMTAWSLSNDSDFLVPLSADCKCLNQQLMDKW